MNFLFFITVLVFAYVPYKGKAFVNASLNHAILLFFWFIFCSFVLIYFVFHSTIIIVNFFTVAFFLICITLWFVSPMLVRRYGIAPSSYIEKNPIRFLVRFEFPSMLIKFGEIVFQQAGFLYVLFLLLAETPGALVWFTILVGILHLWNVFVMPVRLAVFYFVLSIPMAMIFGFLILRGYILLTAGLHLLFYLFFNGSYWFKQSKNSLI